MPLVLLERYAQLGYCLLGSLYRRDQDSQTALHELIFPKPWADVQLELRPKTGDGDAEIEWMEELEQGLVSREERID